jgi:hypothetical protein
MPRISQLGRVLRPTRGRTMPSCRSRASTSTRSEWTATAPVPLLFFSRDYDGNHLMLVEAQ